MQAGIKLGWTKIRGRRNTYGKSDRRIAAPQMDLICNVGQERGEKRSWRVCVVVCVCVRIHVRVRECVCIQSRFQVQRVDGDEGGRNGVGMVGMVWCVCHMCVCHMCLCCASIRVSVKWVCVCACGRVSTYTRARMSHLCVACECECECVGASKIRSKRACACV